LEGGNGRNNEKNKRELGERELRKRVLRKREYHLRLVCSRRGVEGEEPIEGEGVSNAYSTAVCVCHIGSREHEKNTSGEVGNQKERERIFGWSWVKREEEREKGKEKENERN
jgi:hypothetical protein